MTDNGPTAQKASTMPPQYDPQAVEQVIFSRWIKATGGFHQSAAPNGRNNFSVVIPPPNVTGALHLGHAINGTIQDILVRYHRMLGDNTLWMPGIDHAGIATQAVVERTIFEKEKKNRHDLGREELVKRIWEWKENFGGRILEQLKRMGCSCDWPRTRFTLDDVCARAVREAFFKLYEDGLIFRGLRLVNWDTHLQTAVADDEIYYETVKGQMTSIRYPLADRRQGEPEYLIVATTRPETMLGDTAVAVHPEDPRYKQLIGSHVIVPLVGRTIPIIADGLLVDPKFGTGVVKVTPAHDPNDYATGRRHDLPQINLLTPDGKVNDYGHGEFRNRPYNYIGLKFATEARRRVLEDLESLDLIAEAKPHDHEVGHSDRSKTPIEPYLSEQWFVKMGDVEGGIKLANGRQAGGLAQAAVDAVKSGRVKIAPERYTQGYFDWLSKKRDWCISRQLWWGHRIPVWTAHGQGAGAGCVDDKSVMESSRQFRKIMEEVFGRENVHFRPSRRHGNTCLEFCLRTQEAAELMRDVMAAMESWKHHSEINPVGGQPDSSPASFATFSPAARECVDRVWALAGYMPFADDPDVLDTWFSSALWPLSTMGWPDAGTSENPEDRLLAQFYPTSLLSTAREILTLWVARMVMFGLYLHGDVPFQQVYIHAVIQDGQGRPMKKSLGNGVDPVDIIESHGADALRYTLASMATETQDIRLPVVKDQRSGKNTSPRFDAGRNFANKLWNASRFILSHVESVAPPEVHEIHAIAAAADAEIADRWILSRLNSAVERSSDCVEKFRFADLCGTQYQFVWNDLCDWYLEIAKPRINRRDPVVQKILLHLLRRTLALLHPVMPFVTEEIWSRLPGYTDTGLLLNADFPRVDPALNAPDVERKIDLAQQIIRAIRELRNSYNVDLKRRLEVVARTQSAEEAGVIRICRDMIEALANAALNDCGPQAEAPADSGTALVPGAQIFVAGIVDKQAEAKKLASRQQELEKLITGARGKLANDNFTGKAPAAVVEGLREQLSRHEAELQAVNVSLRQYAK